MIKLPALLPFSPLALVLADIQNAINARLYYPALLVALTVPEICAALKMDKNSFVKEKHYVAFVDEYTTPETLGLNGLACFRLRGGIVHRANLAGHPKFGSTHVIFTIPESGIGLHAFSMKSGEKLAAMFDLVAFCKAMVAAAYQWYEDNQKNPAVAENMKNLIRYCPNGIPPFGNGGPVVGSGA